VLSRWFLAQLIFSTLKMEAICSSETSVDTQRTARRYMWQAGACHLLSRWFLAQLIFSTLKMEGICSSETSVDSQWTTRRYISEDGTLHNQLTYSVSIGCTEVVLMEINKIDPYII
jgi:hypothetical protein